MFVVYLRWKISHHDGAGFRDYLPPARRQISNGRVVLGRRRRCRPHWAGHTSVIRVLRWVVRSHDESGCSARCPSTSCPHRGGHVVLTPLPRSRLSQNTPGQISRYPPPHLPYLVACRRRTHRCIEHRSTDFAHALLPLQA